MKEHEWMTEKPREGGDIERSGLPCASTSCPWNTALVKGLRMRGY